MDSQTLEGIFVPKAFKNSFSLGTKPHLKGRGSPTHLGIFASQVKNIFRKSPWIKTVPNFSPTLSQLVEEMIQSGEACLVPNLWSLNIPRMKASSHGSHLT